MDWSLLAGGVSKGMDSALQGNNQGLLQGEQIRSQRAGEALQGAHLGLQQQQLGAHLAQQQFQNQLAQQHLDVTRQQLQNQMAYHNAMLGQHGALLPSQINKNQAEAEWYGTYRPQYYGQWNQIRQQNADTNATRADYYGQGIGDRNAHWQQQHEDNQARIGLLGARLAALQKNVQNPAARLVMQGYAKQLQDINHQMGLYQSSLNNGVRWTGPSYGEMTGKLLAIEEQMNQFAMQQMPGGAQPQGPPAQGGQPTLDSLRQKWGVTPSGR